MRRARLATAAIGITALVVATVPAGGAFGAAAPSGERARAFSAEDPDNSRLAPVKDPVAIGRGGAVSSVDPEATAIGLRVLRRGGTAADAAVAVAAALGVTEPYSAGIGGGGFLLHYDASTGTVSTIDGRETAPMDMPRDAFIDPETGEPYPFSPDLVTSGVSVGVPGTALLWDKALRRWGSLSLDRALTPAARLAKRGFIVDRTFALQTDENAERFAAFEASRDLFLTDGAAPPVGSRFVNTDLARTYRKMGNKGVEWLYSGRLGRNVVRNVRNPRTVPDTDLPVPPGFMRRSDLRDYTAPNRRPTKVDYLGLDVYGMAPPSSGGSTVGESLNILERLPVSKRNPVTSLHLYLESTAAAFADRAANLGDSDFVNVPLRELLSDGFAGERACTIDVDEAAPKPVAEGSPDGDYSVCKRAQGARAPVADTEGMSTTHLSVVDRRGDVVSYTLTIEQTGGSGITVPRRGFLLNNELTDFSTVYEADDPNRIQPGKRPRSSMSPTIVMRDGEPWLAVGSPGGSTIITTVLQVLLNRLDLGMNLVEAVEAPRATQRNTGSVVAEQDFIDLYGGDLSEFGHAFVPPGDPGTSGSEIGAVAAIELRRNGTLVAVAEPDRRGGGDAAVVEPR